MNYLMGFIYLIAAVIVTVVGVYLLSSVQMTGWLHAIQTFTNNERKRQDGQKDKKGQED